VTISPQLGKSAKRNKKSKNLDFDILIDEGNEYAKDLGLVFALPNDLREVYRSFDIDLPKHNGDESWTLPMPARLVINEDNKVVYANVNPDYTVRPEPEEFLKVIQDIRDPLTV
jgi:peroxiredoxin